MTRYILFIFLFFLAITTHAQKVSDVTFSQEQSTIIVSYDLETKTPCKISLFVSTDDGTTWEGPLKKVTGDVGAKIASGNHSITWNVLEEFEELRGDKIKFQVRADGDDLETVIIGTQEWTVKNLDVSRYRNGDIIPEVKDPTEWVNLKTGAWCYYNNDPKNGKIYGKLYNWYAVNDPRGLAPEGFHIPNDIDLHLLTSSFGGQKVVGKLFEKADLKALNYFIGKTKLGGFRINDFGYFYFVNEEGYWWSISKKVLYIITNDGVFDIQNNQDNTVGFSVRCIRD